MDSSNLHCRIAESDTVAAHVQIIRSGCTGTTRRLSVGGWVKTTAKSRSRSSSLSLARFQRPCPSREPLGQAPKEFRRARGHLAKLITNARIFVEFSPDVYCGHDGVWPAIGNFSDKVDGAAKVTGHQWKGFMKLSKRLLPLLEHSGRKPIG